MSDDAYQKYLNQLVGIWAQVFNFTTKLLYGGIWSAEEVVDENDIGSSEVSVFFEGRLLQTANTTTSGAAGGAVSFAGIPLDKQLSLRVVHPQYPPRTVAVFSQAPNPNAEVYLAAAQVQLQDFVLTVKEAETSAPVSGAVVSYRTLEPTPQTGEITTQADGTAVIRLSNLQTVLSLNINAENFQAAEIVKRGTDSRAEVRLARSASSTEGEGGTQPQRGSVVVIVRNAAGEQAASRVTLYQENSSTALGAANTESGSTRFDSIATVGTSVYAVVEPVNEASGEIGGAAGSEELLPKTTEAQPISANEDLQFIVELTAASASATQDISLTITDSNGAVVPNAAIKLYGRDNKVISQGVTDNRGSVTFTISSLLQLGTIYASINADGFLPFAAVVSQRSTSLSLTRLAAGNNVDFSVNVFDADNRETSGATVDLMDEAGHMLGVSEETGISGIATFHKVAADMPMRVVATLDTSHGSSDVFSVSFGDSGDFHTSVILSRPTGSIIASVRNIVDNAAISGVVVSALVDSPAGQSVANCTTDENGECTLDSVWSGHDIYLSGEKVGFGSASISSGQRISPASTKLVSLFLVEDSFKNQTSISLVSMVDDKGNEIPLVQPLERGRIYTAHFAASFAEGSTKQELFVRLGNAASTSNENAVIKSFEFSPSAIGQPHSFSSISYNPSGECSSDLLNADVNNEGKKWIAVDYNGVSGVVDLAVRVFVKPTSQPSEKVVFNYRALAVKGGKYSRTPFDDDLQLNRRTQGKDECYSQTIERSFDIVEGTSVCNSQGTACVSVKFTGEGGSGASGSPFLSTLNRPFDINLEVRSFGSVEASSAYAKITSVDKSLKFTDYRGDGTASLSSSLASRVSELRFEGVAGSPVARILFGESKELYAGTLTAVGVTPSDFAGLRVEFGDARGPVAVHERAFAVVEGTGTLQITQLTPTEFEVGKAHDLRFSVRSENGLPITDATISFEEENGSPFDGDVPSQIAGDGSTGNGEDGKYTIRRVRPRAAGTFTMTASRDRYRSATQELVAKVSNFFEFDQPDFISMSCNSSTLNVRNTLDVETTVDVYVTPACARLSAPGLTEVATQGGQQGELHYRLPNFRAGSSRIVTLSPNSGDSCQVEFVAKDSRSGTKSLDAPIQIQNTCNSAQTTSFQNADGIIYINGNVFQPPRLLVDTFSQFFYGRGAYGGGAAYGGANSWDPRYFDAVSYSSSPAGGLAGFGQRAGLIDPTTGMPYSQFLDPSFRGDVRQQLYSQQGGQPGGQFGGQFGPQGQPGQFGAFGVADSGSGGAFFDISRANLQRSWTVAWVNQDPVPHSFICKDRQGRAVVQVDGLPAGGVHVFNFTRPGLYYCKLDNSNKGTLKIKSMCPKKGALYYTRLLTRCMARQAIGDSGIFNGGTQHAARVAASVKTKFVVFGNRISVGQDSDTPGVDCSGSTGGASCELKITPLVPTNGFAFSIQDQTGAPDFTGRQVSSNVLGNCFEVLPLETTSSYRALLQPVSSLISAVGLTSSPQFKSYTITFNKNGQCVKLVPQLAGDHVNFAPKIWNGQNRQLLEGPAILVYELQSNRNPSNKYRVEVKFDPVELIDGRYLFTTIPTTVGQGSNKLFYRTNSAGDPKEPGFIINNIPQDLFLLPSDQQPAQATAIPTRVKPNSLSVLTGNEVPGALNSISDLEKGFYICAASGGCPASANGIVPVRPFEAVTDPAASQLGNKLGDVVGNYHFSTPASQLGDNDKPFACSGVNYCSGASEQEAVGLAQNQIEEVLKQQYQYVETINLDSALDNTQDALSGCMDEAFKEIIAQEAQYQMCKTLVNMCSGRGFVDVEEEEVEEGESFAAGLSLDTVLGDSQTIVKDIICEETQAGQNLQALRQCLAPGSPCRQLVAQRIAGNLRQTQIQSVVHEQPVIDLQNPILTFVTKRIRDSPDAAHANIAEGVSRGGYNVYRFEADASDLIGAQGQRTRESGAVLFSAHPPGYDLSKFISRAASATGAAGVAPLRLPEAIYDWATDTSASIPTSGVQELTNGFPFIRVERANPLTTRVKFDGFKPNLLTLNKYPIMLSTSTRTRETVRSTAGVSGGSNRICTLRNRPVDPLQLFDSCEDLDRQAQQNYDALTTPNKAPFAKSLVFHVVPAAFLSSPNQPVWPTGYEGGFRVSISPANEFFAAGSTQSGPSQPLVAYIPVIGGVLGASRTQQVLQVPQEDVTRYAVQVTDCIYVRGGGASGGAIIPDPAVTSIGNCGATEPVSTLFPGSTPQTLTVTIRGSAKTCTAATAADSCVVALLKDGKLSVATLTPQGMSLDLEARALMRYFTDEKSVSSHLQRCTIEADENVVIAKCPAIARVARPPLVPAAEPTPQPAAPAAATTAAQQPPAPQANLCKAGAIGDSLTTGPSNYVTRLNSRCGGAEVMFRAYGIGGQQTGQMAARFQHDILDNNYKDVIIFGGVNDILSDKPLSQIENNLNQMYSAAKSANRRVIAVTVTPWKGHASWTTARQAETEELNSWILSNQVADFAVDTYSALEDPANPGALKTEYASSDKLHPSSQGQIEIGNQIFLGVYGISDTCLAQLRCS